MEQERESERGEVYERIPWEMLEPKKPDRQWLVLAVAGAVVLGAVAYSLVSNSRTVQPVSVGTQEAVTVPATAPDTVAAPPPASVPQPTQPPPPEDTEGVVTAEADLYAIHPERLVDRVAAQAEWFVSEYLTYDGSELGREILTSLLPEDLPLPTAAEGTRVFVEWVRAADVDQVDPLTYRVTVLARTLAASGDAAYTRQPPFEVEVDMSVSGDVPTVRSAPVLRPAATGDAGALSLTEVPEDVAKTAVETVGSGEVIGGAQLGDGSWEVVVVAPGADGVSRAQTIVVSGPPG